MALKNLFRHIRVNQSEHVLWLDRCDTYFWYRCSYEKTLLSFDFAENRLLRTFVPKDGNVALLSLLCFCLSLIGFSARPKTQRHFERSALLFHSYFVKFFVIAKEYYRKVAIDVIVCKSRSDTLSTRFVFLRSSVHHFWIAFIFGICYYCLWR